MVKAKKYMLIPASKKKEAITYCISRPVQVQKDIRNQNCIQRYAQHSLIENKIYHYHQKKGPD